jgi:isopentenyl phosphate kinase
MSIIRNNSITIIKIGGGTITDKNEPFSFREEVLNSLIEEMDQYNGRMILIHGGGSYGHPLAKKYKLQDGRSLKIKNQSIGVTKTHDAMIKLNQFFLKKLIENNMPGFTFHSSSNFYVDEVDNIEFFGKDILIKSLNEGFIPIFYGDVVFSEINSFRILSGDEIALELCRFLGNKVKKVIFTIEEDGIYKKLNEDDKLQGIRRDIITNISYEEIKNMEIANLETKIDVTGGMKGKLKFVEKIAELGISIHILNGKKSGRLIECLKSKKNSINTLIRGKY